MSERSTSNLTPAVAAGVRLTTLQQGFEQVVRLLFTVVLARFVAPADFGLMSMAFVVTYLAILVSDLGVGTALIQRRDLRTAHVTTAFTVSSIFGIVLAVAMAAAARPISAFFGEPRLVPVLVAASATFVCKGVQGAPRDMLCRDLRFLPYTVTATVALMAGVVVGVVAGAMGAGVWALVAYSLVESVVGMVLSLAAALRARVWHPAIGIERAALRDLAGFAGYTLGARSLVYVQNTADNVVVGRMLGASALGFYGLAYRTVFVPVQKIADVATTVAVPALAAVQRDTPRLRSAFLRAQQAAAMVSFPVSLGAVLVSPVAIPMLLGPQWRPAIPTMQILAFNGPRLVLGRLAAALFQATGRPAWDFTLLLVAVPMSVAAFIIGAPHGTAGVAVGLTVVGGLLASAQLVLVARVLDATVGKVLGSIGGISGATVAMVAAVIGVRALLPGDTGAGFELCLIVLVGTLAYVAALSAFAPGLLSSVVSDVLRRGAPAARDLEAVAR